MKEILEKLWDEYFFDKCAVMNTDEEREMTKRVVELHETANASLNKEQKEAIEKYVDALCDTEALFVKKAFFKGCGFAVSFILAVGDLGK